MSAVLDDLDAVFAALADPSRRAVLERLAQTGEGTATSLAEDLPISRQAIVKHLAQLNRAELVEGRKRGREMRYRVCTDRLSSAGRRIQAIAVDWDRTLAALKRIAEEEEEESAD
jgi:DNA-binding transcriptional ArsR family regulator